LPSRQRSSISSIKRFHIPGPPTAAAGDALPQLASVAQQAGRHCAKNIIATVSGGDGTPFEYLDKGIMAMVGRNAAVAEIGAHRHTITGTLAFTAWLGVHALLLTTARAKIDTFLEWAWEYFGHVHVDPILDRPDVGWSNQVSAAQPD
jgi:NADH dehydrogenase